MDFSNYLWSFILKEPQERSIGCCHWTLVHVIPLEQSRGPTYRWLESLYLRGCWILEGRTRSISGKVCRLLPCWTLLRNITLWSLEFSWKTKEENQERDCWPDVFWVLIGDCLAVDVDWQLDIFLLFQVISWILSDLRGCLKRNFQSSNHNICGISILSWYIHNSSRLEFSDKSF